MGAVLPYARPAQPRGPGLYAPRVEDVDGLQGIEQSVLPPDAQPYGTVPEALRHGQQQAVRWANDRMSDGQGQFWFSGRDRAGPG